MSFVNLMNQNGPNRLLNENISIVYLEYQVRNSYFDDIYNSK